MDWSFQLYSARETENWPKVVKILARLGYKQVEGFGGVYDDPAGFRAELDKNALTMPTGHFAIDVLENDFQKADGIAKTFGMKMMVCPYLNEPDRPKDGKGWGAFGKRLLAASNKAKDAGYGFAWHNHDFEFKALPDGSTPMQRIFEAAPDLGWEMDVAWIVRGDADPRIWIAEHADNILAVHVKDIAKPGEGTDEDGWSDVGDGTIDWKDLIAELKAKTKAEYYIMEHDKPSKFRRFAKRSINAANEF